MTIATAKYTLPVRLQQKYLTLLDETSQDVVQTTGAPVMAASLVALHTFRALTNAMENEVRKESIKPANGKN